MCAIVKKDKFTQSEKLKSYAFGFYLEFVLISNRLLIIKHMNNLNPESNAKVIEWLREKSVAFGCKSYDMLSHLQNALSLKLSQEL